MKTVYIDIDDVLCETAIVLAELIGREFGKNVAYENITSFDLSKSFKLDELETERLFEMFHDDTILASIPVIDGAADALRLLHSKGVTIHIVTGRPPSTHVASKLWLATHEIPYNKLSFVDKYDRNHEHIDGVDILSLDDLKLLKFDVAIDDSPIAISFLAENTENPIIVFDRPWNVDLGDLKGSPQIRRCKTWGDVLEIVAG